ncbi:hypothetical protein ACFXD5_19545 [Streptomyces sp. NPDC059385]|uniref:hypothetical protein n=1 Tax=Streptomyces sp. NPDC059385 TaxID=3346817 RepID=UPI0036B2030D
MRIRHSRLTKDFLQVPNATVRDDRMSHMARGILVELLSRPDGWKANCDDMWQASVAKHGKDSPGRRQFRAAFAELKEAGYLTTDRAAIEGGKHATVLTLTDVPQGGTSVRTGETRETAGRADVPHAGTSGGSTDVPHAGTSVPPAETGISPGRTDVPLSDVPPCGTSKEENGEKNTGLKNTSSSAAPANGQQDDEEDLSAFGAFWIVYPKSRDQEKTLAAWREAVASGVDPQRIKAAAEAYARESAGKDRQYVKLSVNWLKDKRYNDRFDEPAPAGQPALRVIAGQKHQPFQPNPKANYSKGFGS